MERASAEKLRRFAWPVLLLGLFLLLLKLIALRAAPRDLDFLLAPAVSAVRLLTGHSFAFSDEAGYVHESGRIVIATDCSGIKLWGTAAAAAVGLSFLLRPRPFGARALLSFALCLAGSYPFAVVLNAVRIAAGIAAYLSLSPDASARLARTLHARQGALIELAGLAGFALLVLIIERKAVRES
ncbi:MAG: exosortase K [Spirochaetales bacterium]|nr:exosortase K [Spirochaetales bacterium]